VIRPGRAVAQGAAGAAAAARGAKILDLQSAVAYIASTFGIDDPAEVVTRLEAEMLAAASALESELLAGAPPLPGPTPGDTPATPATEPAAEALSGGQIVELQAMAEKAYTGALPRESVIAIARAAFPRVPPALIEAAIPQPKPPALPAPDPLAAPPPPGPPASGIP
jgi:hypothetical protein